MRKFFIISTLLFIQKINAQLPPLNTCLGTDISVCEGQTVNLSQCSGSGLNGIFLNNPTEITFTDDEYSPAVNIGFNFNFYGNSYNQIVIGSNSIVTFDLTQANGYCPYSTSSFPTSVTSGVQNSIALAWQDIYPPLIMGNGGGVFYQSIGTAPNRKFVISYESISYFSTSCQSTSECYTSAIVLNETTNEIEMFTTNKSFCTAWNSGLAVQGIQNASGTIAHTVTGRNNTTWAAQLDGKKFTPISSTNYTISNTPFVSINSAISTTTQWINTLGQTFPYIPGSPLNITNIPPGTSGYYLTASTCGVGVASISDTTFITRMNTSVSATSTQDVCNLGVGTATATALTGTAPYTYSWSNGANTQTASGLSVGTYIVTMTTADLCPSTDTVTITSPPLNFTASSTQISCPNGNNGTATAFMNPPIPGLTYLWDDQLSQTTATATGLLAGTYNCTITAQNGCSGNTQVTVTEIPGMKVSLTAQAVSCNSQNNGVMSVVVTQGTPGYNYSWDKSNSISSIANNLPAGINTVTITDNNGCSIQKDTTLSEPLPLSIVSISSDTSICPNSSFTLSANGSGGSSTYTYTWTENGNLINSSTSPFLNITPSIQSIYCVTLSEACGSPVKDSCLTISIPQDIIPDINSLKNKDCSPASFELFNSSLLSNEIKSTLFDFGDGQILNEMGNDSTSHTYNIIGDFNVKVTITSIYNCIYTSTFNNFFTSLPLPKADFSINSNPTTIFETTVKMDNNSSTDAVSWNWSSPKSEPSFSNAKEPYLKFPDGIENTYPITLVVSTIDNCIDSITHELKIIPDVIFYAPNTFTPDYDSHNQTWKIFVDGIDESEFVLSIYNRWGELIWETKDVNGEWDGSYNGNNLTDGNFNWVATTKDINTDKRRSFTGQITLMK
jgi:gliding motility-associated-like protein